MRTTFLVALLLTSSIMAASDPGVRAFLGIRSAGITLTKMNRRVTYVFALARLEKGRFIKFERMSNGSLSAQKDATFELVWGKNNGQYGYAFVEGESTYEFKADPIFENYVFDGGQSTGEYNTAIGHAPEFKGMKVIAGAYSSLPKDPLFIVNPSSQMGEALADVDCAILVLFKECQTVNESLEFMRGLKSLK